MLLGRVDVDLFLELVCFRIFRSKVVKSNVDVLIIMLGDIFLVVEYRMIRYFVSEYMLVENFHLDLLNSS